MRIASKATKGKGKKWKRGMSSSCNPNNKTHRLRVSGLQSIDSRPQSQQLRLTQDVISHYDSIQLQKLRLDNDSNNLNDISKCESIGNESFATVYTNCSNISFNKFLNGFHSSSAIHKQMLSVLAAITETIHSNGGKETETEYFAILMTCLESAENEETLTAIISLLQMVIKRLPPNVIKLKFSETSKVFVEYLAKYIKGENGVLVRSLTNSIATILQHQEYAVWELSSTQHIFESILSLTIHNKPRIRKTAHKAVARILRSDINRPKTTLCHPIAKLTADFCIRKIEENGVNDNISSSLYILSLINDILQVLPNSSLKKCCETILTLMTFGNVLIVSAAFKAFFTLFSAKPNEHLLTPELNAKLISALYDYQPNINDSQPLCAWSTALKEGVINLNRIDKRLSFNHLPKMFNIFISCLLSESREVHLCVTNNLKQIYTECVEPSTMNIDKDIVEKMYSSLENALKYQYSNAWFSIFNLIPHLFNENFGDHSHEIIKALIVIRESYDCVYASDIDRTIGRAVQVFGPKFVVNLCKLRLNDEKSDLSHNWLLPVLRDYVKNTELGFFVDYFVPLATVLQNSSEILESNGNLTNAKTCSILITQIWSLLPSFCIQPTDFEISFKKIAKTLGSIIADNRLLRGFVLTAFRNLSKCFENQTLKLELSRFSKNFIPILLNVYTTEPELDDEKNQRFSIFDIIQLFLTITENSLIVSFYTKVKEKLKNGDNESFLKHSLLDLIRTFVPYLRINDIKEIYESFVNPFIKDNKLGTEQKKAFRIVEEICKNDSNVCQTFLKENLIEIINPLIKTLSECLSSSKSYALKAIKVIVEKESNNDSIEWNNLFLEIIAKTLDCLLINSQKVKSAAFDLIISITNVYKSLNNKETHEFIEHLMSSFLNKSEYSSTAVIMALTRLYTEFRKEIPKRTECNLVEKVISCLRSNNRQTIQSSIDFLKCFFRNASADQLSSYLEILIHSLSDINPKHQKHFRIKIRELFIRLVRKYGYPMISKMIPQSYKKVLKNIRKVEDRKKRMSEKESDGNDREIKTKKSDEIQDILADTSDDESDVNEDEFKSISRKNESWIKEDLDDDNEVIDLLSNKMSQNIVFKKPERQTVSKEKFPISEDGRIVIQDIDQKRGMKRTRNEVEDIDEINDIEDDEMSTKQSVKSFKSKQSYQTGGKGIHRAVNKDKGEEYKSLKARGDMKRKGRPDPYAYIPLNRQTLNRRNKSKFSGQFTNIVRAAKKGAEIGSKNRFKKLRKK